MSFSRLREKVPEGRMRVCHTHINQLPMCFAAICLADCISALITATNNAPAVEKTATKRTHHRDLATILLRKL
ncbi:hypothetical protein [Xanthomonas phaseoli]|uniref:hypothetical protein n=1 Tax=Xanthomonas phaseoli TaxID=1985254 RepID=UPI002226750E|nr:hypothetical protein [Xanthomonas phaseoli]UZB28833.1 hypothetical protein OM951_20890 [Xanthomonas phaseoli pv. phaseoli]